MKEITRTTLCDEGLGWILAENIFAVDKIYGLTFHASVDKTWYFVVCLSP